MESVNYTYSKPQLHLWFACPTYKTTSWIPNINAYIVVYNDYQVKGSSN